MIRAEVLDYLKACSNLLAANAGSHDEFMTASQILHHKEGHYTDEELALVQDMLRRVSAKLGQYNYRGGLSLP